MTIKFLLLENGFGDDTFQSLLKTIQSRFGFFTAILNRFYPSFSRDIPQLNDWIDPSSPDTVSHSFARCYTTRSIIDELFGISKWYNYCQFSPDDMAFRIISIGGPMFPDHTFVLIKVRGEIFLLQSYYYAYLLSGKYGVLQLDAESLAELDTILNTYRAITNDEIYITPELLLNLRLRLSVFTGIDSSRSVGNIAGATFWRGLAGRNRIDDDVTFANSQVVFDHFKQKLLLFEQTVKTAPVTPEEFHNKYFNIVFNYHFSDAFIPDEYVNVGGIQALPDAMRSHRFHILVGTEHPPGNALGIEHGPVGGVEQCAYFVSRKTVRVPVAEIYAFFDTIKHKVERLELQSIQSNNRYLGEIGGINKLVLEQTILLDETQQVLKLERARYFVTNFPQYRR
jgi:hypothetical protein